MSRNDIKEVSIHLPPEVNFRLKVHQFGLIGLSAEIVGANKGIYKISSANDANQQILYDTAIRLLDRAFPDFTSIVEDEPETAEDREWNIKFSFSRTEPQIEWDTRLFEACHALSLASSLKEENRLSSASRYNCIGMNRAIKTLRDAYLSTNDPALNSARQSLQEWIRETSFGASLPPLPYGENERVAQNTPTEIARKAVVSMIDMLDTGHDLATHIAPTRPDGREDRRAYNRLWWTRNALLVGLSLKETQDIKKATDGFSKDMVMALAHLREIATMRQDEALDTSRWALSEILSESPKGREHDQMKGTRRSGISVDEAEDAILGGADALMEMIENYTPAQEMGLKI